MAVVFFVLGFSIFTNYINKDRSSSIFIHKHYTYHPTHNIPSHVIGDFEFCVNAVITAFEDKSHLDVSVMQHLHLLLHTQML